MRERLVVTKRDRFAVLNRDGFTCQYCGAKAPDVRLEVDHIIPFSKGGSHDVSNLITACHDCNLGKGNKSVSGRFLKDQPIKAPPEEPAPQRETLRPEEPIRFTIRQLRMVLLDASQSEAASRLGISLNTYRHYEMRPHLMPAGYVQELLKMANISSDLLNIPDRREEAPEGED